MAKILLLGANGQVGYELQSALRDVIAPPRGSWDLLDMDSLRRVVEENRPDVVINAAADTAVDRAESNSAGALAANGDAPAALAQACTSVGARLVHYSTDYVFDATKGMPYVESDPTKPVNTYGETKLRGEEGVLGADPRHLVFRLSWVYSWRGRNFALTMLRLAREGKAIRVVADQVGSPSYAPDIARATAEVVGRLLTEPKAAGGLYHMTARGETNWSGFAQALLNEALGADAPVVEPIPTEAYPTPAARPKYSVLDSRALDERFSVSLPDWRDGVVRWARDLHKITG